MSLTPAAPAPNLKSALQLRALLQDARHDRSLYGLVAANLLASGIAVAQGVGLREMMLVYWTQSVIIGASFFLRMLKLERFSTAGLKSGNEPVPETQAGKLGIAVFFLFHYGIFHLVYLIFIVAGAGDDETPAMSASAFLVCVLGFLAGHGYSLYENLQRDRQGKPNLGALMILPYARILPMHFTIIFGGVLFGGLAALLLFTLLKTVADALMHLAEHRLLRGGARDAAA